MGSIILRRGYNQNIMFWMSLRKYPLVVCTWLEKGDRWVFGVKVIGNDPNPVLLGLVCALGSGHERGTSKQRSVRSHLSAVHRLTDLGHGGRMGPREAPNTDKVGICYRGAALSPH